MSDGKQPEHMRPIPDGGLKDAMPSWLKRPPAWRDLPTAEQRHERSLPEPDTSEIDPRSLVDVTDLPQWLQAIAARGDIPVPVPDASVDHAVEVVQEAQRPVAIQTEPDGKSDSVGSGIESGLEAPTSDTSAPETTPSVAVGTTASDPLPTTPAPPPSGRLAVPVWMLAVAALVIVALLTVLFVLL